MNLSDIHDDDLLFELSRRLAAKEHENSFRSDVLGGIRGISTRLTALEGQENNMANTLDDVLNDVQSESTVDDSIITLFQGVQSQLAAALANTTIAPADQAKIDAIFSGIEANKAKVAAAVTAGTPASTVAGGTGTDTTTGGASA